MLYRLSAFRSRSFRWVSVCLIAMTVSVANSSDLSAQDFQFEIKRAEALMRIGKLEEAKLVLGKAGSAYWRDYTAQDYRYIQELLLECSLRLYDFSEAIARIENSIKDVFEAERIDRTSRRRDPVGPDRLVSRLEFAHHLYQQIQIQTNAETDEKILKKLANRRIALNFRLIETLGGNVKGEKASDHTQRRFKRSWWWSGITKIEKPSGTNLLGLLSEWRDRLSGKVQFGGGRFQRFVEWGGSDYPIGKDGNLLPIIDDFQTYPAEGSNGAKVLFLLKEIEQLDGSKNKHRAARALLTRAKLMRELYGIHHSTEWQGSFSRYQDVMEDGIIHDDPRTIRNRQLLQSLTDEQTRLKLGGIDQTIELPADQNPLALFRELRERFPNSKSVPESYYEEGVYHQSRLQYQKALDAFRMLRQEYREHPLAKKAQKQLDFLEDADVILHRTGVFPSGRKPELSFSVRNASRIEFSVRSVDLNNLGEETNNSVDCSIQEMLFLILGAYDYLGYPDNQRDLNYTFWKKSGEIEWNDASRLFGSVTHRWSEEFQTSLDLHIHSTTVPFLEPGGYLVEAHIPWTTDYSYGLVIVSDLGIVAKPLSQHALYWFIDLQSGKPLSEKEIELALDFNRAGIGKTRKTRVDENGVFLGDWNTIGIAVENAQGSFATHSLYDQSEWFVRYEGLATTGFTDRPVYRPGDTVKFHFWTREPNNRVYLPAKSEIKLQLSVRDPKGNVLKQWEVESGRNGAVDGSYALTTEAALGEYSIRMMERGDNYTPKSITFRVEEYKKPEFEVTVEPTRTEVESEETLEAKVTARYYFGEPVTQGEVRYQIFREPVETEFHTPREFDWLYGAGYGRYASSYPWLGDPEAVPPPPPTFDEWTDGEPDPERELVTSGETKLDADGTATIRFEQFRSADTSRNSRYTIEAEVADASRRTIVGSGEILSKSKLITPVLELDRGWYRPGEDIQLQISTRSSSGAGVSVSGSGMLYRVVDSKNDTPQIQPELIWGVITDEDGRGEFKFEDLSPGQYRIDYAVNNQAGQVTSAATTFWVYGPEFDASKYRFHGIEIVPDQRTYRVGETARLLVTVNHPNAYVLLVNSNGGHRVVEIPDHAQVLDFPITKEHSPNVHLDVFTVFDGEVSAAQIELFVPPVPEILTVELQTDKHSYGPGETGQINIKVTDSEGTPVSGEITLAAYDESVTYIQKEYPSGPRDFLKKRLAENVPWDPIHFSNLGRHRYATTGQFLLPEFHTYQDYKTYGWLYGGRMGVGAAGGFGLGGMGGMGGAGFGGAAFGGGGFGGGGGGFGGPLASPEPPPTPFASPTLRKNFADTALWLPSLALNANGTAVAEITFPDSHTNWRIRGAIVTNETHIGETRLEVKVSSPLLVRLQTPRFLIEGDRVVLSANVHNYLASDKQVTTELLLPSSLFVAREIAGTEINADGMLRLTSSALVKADSETRFDFPVEVIASGSAEIQVNALTDESSDAMQKTIPISIHGVPDHIAANLSFTPKETGAKEFTFELPPETDLAQPKLELSIAPSAGVSAFAALPFLAQYPYGCVEQTMSRFYPTVLASKTLQQLGLDLDQLAPPAANQRASVLDSAEMQKMAEAGLARLYRFQHDDGGWGWWEHDQSDVYMTAYVLMGLKTAQDAGLEIRERVIEDGLQYLMTQMRNQTEKGSAVSTELHTRTMVAYAVTSVGEPAGRTGQRFPAAVIPKYLESLNEQRHRLNPYGESLLALSYFHLGKKEQAQVILRDVLERLKIDEERGLAFVETSPKEWWRGQNSNIEANAWVLRAIVQIDPENKLSPLIVNWLIANRQNGTYWRSTRDSAMAVSAIAEYLTLAPDTLETSKVEISLNGHDPLLLDINWKETSLFGSTVSLDPAEMRHGSNTLSITKPGPGALSVGMHLRYFLKSEEIPPRSFGLSVTREYFKVPRFDEADPQKRTPLQADERVSIGDQIEVELTVETKERHEYLAFEDPKPAGFEPVQLQSGHPEEGGRWANVELRDERVVFFARSLSPGKTTLKYRLRAETPGRFRVLPTYGFPMYTPEINGRSAAALLEVSDR